MTQDRFADLLHYPHLDELPDEAEVNGALLRYPYCQSFHILRAKMHEYTRHVNAKKSLNMAAAYSTDRTFLYHVMKNLHEDKIPVVPEQVVDLTNIFNEPILTLDEPPVSQFEILAMPVEVSTNGISMNGNGHHSPEIEEEIPFEIEPFEGEFVEDNEPLTTTDLFDIAENVKDDIQPESQQDEIIEEEASLTVSELFKTEENIKTEIQPKPIEKEIVEENELLTVSELFKTKENVQEEIEQKPHEIIEDDELMTVSKLFETEEIPRKKKKVKRKKKKKKNVAAINTQTPDFTDWLMNLEAPKAASFDIEKEVKKAKKPKKTAKSNSKNKASKSKKTGDKGKRLKKIIEKSVKTDTGLVSETLADLLVSQGKNKKAIKMYEQLSLKFPEKSAYFAAQIKKLMSE